MQDSHITGNDLTITGKASLDNATLTTDGAGNITAVGATLTGTLTGVAATLSGALTANSTVSGGQSATAPATATSGTIATAGLRVSRVSPAGAITAVILAAGTLAGQEVTVINEAVAANTITFDVAGTSKVADGVSTTIPGLTAARYVWDSVTNLWYRTK